MIARLLLALALGFRGARHPQAALTSLALCVSLLIGTISLARTGASILAAAFSLAGLVFVAVALTRLSPRTVLVLVLLILLPLGVVTAAGDALPTPPPARGALGIALLALLVVLTLRPSIGLRVANSLVAAMLLFGVGPFVNPRWAWTLTALTLFVLSGLRPRKLVPLPWRAVLVPTAVASAALALLVVALAWLAPTPATPNQQRLARLKALAPQGGIAWPLPSEAILWDGTLEPAVTNLDALYLGGSDAALPVRLPETSLWGRFAVNGQVHELRAIKEPGEKERLRKASQATVDALLDSLPLFRVGGSEAGIAAAIRAGYRRHGCSQESFPPIVAAGRNALNPHYFANSSTLAAGDVVVVDIGCYVDHYASDFTRTLPVGGVFTPRARTLYAALDEAARVAERACRPGAYLYGRTPRGGKPTQAKIVEDMLREKTGQERMPHGLGHPIGLFVHDVFDWNEPLRTGMVVMIEPGVYLKDEGIALRLEDAYEVTDTGCESITSGFPTDADAVERLVAAALKR